jgi:hypothetical protein
VPTKGYVVLRRGSEYNDEITSLHEGGDVEKVFVDKPRAEAYLDELFYEEFKDGFCFSEYCYSIEDIARGRYNSEEFLEKFKEIVGEYADGDEEMYEIKKGISKEQAAALRKIFDLDLFYIEETEIT